MPCAGRVLQSGEVRRWVDPWLEPRLGADGALPGYDVRIDEHEVGFAAWISLVDWQLTLQLDPAYLSRVGGVLGLSDEEAERAGDDTAVLLYLHETGHWLYAPFDASGHERILTGLVEGLGGPSKVSADDPRVSNLCNMFTDIIVNVTRASLEADHRIQKKFRGGWATVTRFHYREPWSVGPWFRAFITLQQRLMDHTDLGLRALVRAFERDRRVLKAVAELAEVFRPQGALSLLARSDWKSQARRFAEILGPLNEGESFNLPPTCDDNVFTRRYRQDRRYREELARSALREGVPPEDLRVVTLEEALRVYYEDRAADIVLQAEAPGDETEAPVAFAGVRRLGPEEPVRMGAVRWTATRPLPGGDLLLFEKAHPLTVDRPGTPVPGRLPDLLFVLDSSASMGWGRGRSRDQEFDHALLALFGIRKWLERTGKGMFLRYAAINFSQETVASGWVGYDDLDPIWRTMLHHQGGLTQLDPAVLGRLAEEHRAAARLEVPGTDCFWCLLISDGDIHNGGEVLPVIASLLQEGNFVTLLQLGGATLFSRAVERVGADVRLIGSASDLVGLALQSADGVWG